MTSHDTPAAAAAAAAAATVAATTTATATATTAPTVTLDIHQILKLLPHRYPFLLVDRVIGMEKNKHITAIKNVTMNEPFFNGHFPHRPVMPGVLMLEAMAQAAALLSFYSLDIVPDDKMVYYFAGIDDARFKRPVEPGDQLRLEVGIDRLRSGVSRFNGRAFVGSELACEATLLCAMRQIG